jgi:hypothetical protein
MKKKKTGTARPSISVSLRNVWLAAGAGLAVLASQGAMANVTCEGKVTYLGLSPEGFISVSVNGYGVWYICNQTTTFAGNGGVNFTPEGCRASYASILAAQKADQSIRLFFNTSATTGNGPECTALGNWAYPTPAPYHMTIM